MKNFGDIQKLAQKMQADMAKAQEDLAGVTVERAGRRLGRPDGGIEP